MDKAYIRANRHKNKVDGIKDSSPIDAVNVSYVGEDFSTIKA